MSHPAGEPTGPTPQPDPEVAAAEKAKLIAAARQAEAEAKKAEAEALAAVEKARRDAVNADRDATMADEKAKAENDKAVAEARTAAAKAWVPEHTTAQLEGTTTAADGTGTIGRVAALGLLRSAATEIAAKVKTAGADRVLIVDDVDLAASDFAHALVNSQITRLAAAAARVKRAIQAAEGTRAATHRATGAPLSRFLPGVGAAATAVPALVGAVADVAGYFRSDYTVGKVDVTVTSTPLVTAVAGALITEGITVHVDGFALFDPLHGTVRSFGQMLDARWDLLDVRLRAVQGLMQVAKDAVTAATEVRDGAATAVGAAPADQAAKRALADAEGTLLAAQARVAEIQGLLDSAAKLEELIDTHVTAMTQVATGQSLPPLGLAALRDVLHDPTRDVHVLALTTDQIGADSINRRSIFGRARTVYVGAAHVSALLLAPGGDVVVGATVARTSTTRMYLRTGRLDPVDPTSDPEAGATKMRVPRPGALVQPPIAAAQKHEEQRGRKPARWTLMVFMAGMNNLAAEADKDIDEIVAGNPGEDIEVVVFVKQPNGARRFVVNGEEQALPSGIDSGDPNTVVDFVRWATSVAPAEHYALILWNHGSGWEPWAFDMDQPVAVRAVSTPNGVQKVNSVLFPVGLVREVTDANARQRAILTDDGTAHAVDTIELGRAVAAISNQLQRKLDVLAMDACLMSNLEVVYELRKHVEVVVSSEELEPGTGWHYTDLITRMRGALDGLGPKEFGALAVASYLEGYQPTSEQVTLCAVDANGAETLRDTVDSLADALVALMPTTGSGLLTDALVKACRFTGHLVDLGQLCERLGESLAEAADDTPAAAVREAARAVVQAISPGNGYVLTQGSQGDSLTGVHGVSIYLPARTDELAVTYQDIEFAQSGRWHGLIRSFRDVGSAAAG